MSIPLALKKEALANIDIALAEHVKTRHTELKLPKELSTFIVTNNPEIKQGLNIHQIREEIEKETKTGELFARIWSMRLK